MFSGIIRESGVVLSRDSSRETHAIEIELPLFEREGKEIGIGGSVAVSGVCLTVVALSGPRARFDLATETRSRTNLGLLEIGARVHLEPSLRVGDGVDGHFVMGHVDAVEEVLELKRVENTLCVAVSLHRDLEPYVAEKGSVALDGVSLTVGQRSPGRFLVYIVPHTHEVTLFSEYQVGSRLNLEVDSIARYVVSVLPYFAK